MTATQAKNLTKKFEWFFLRFFRIYVTLGVNFPEMHQFQVSVNCQA